MGAQTLSLALRLPAHRGLDALGGAASEVGDLR